MPQNHSDQVLKVLSWHAHDKGGVRVPFRGGGEPLGRVIQTPLVLKLQAAAAGIAQGDKAPRWIFLVGGPGNGKSQMVETFLAQLDLEVEAGGNLIRLVTSAFKKSPIPRRVDIGAASDQSRHDWQARVPHMVVVQDASASDSATSDAAGELATDVAELLATAQQDQSPLPVFICCVNRGLLARAIAAAAEAGQTHAVSVFRAVAQTTGLGSSALGQDKAISWPMTIPGLTADIPATAGLIACWPLDVESLLLDYAEGKSPVDEIFDDAISDEHWEGAACGDCTSRWLCPFIANATSLRDTRTRRGLTGILRRSELAAGQRWNFRYAFALAAELVVGERDDFADGGGAHPCDWVHQTVQGAGDIEPAVAAPSYLALVRRSYEQALFPGLLPTPSDRTQELTHDKGLPVAAAVVDALPTDVEHAPTSIRRRLLLDILPSLDPAIWTPEDEEHPLSRIENSYSQSVAQGNDLWEELDAAPSPAERGLLGLLALAELELDNETLSLESKRAAEASRFLRQLAVTLAKRAIGVRLGFHANEQFLIAYEEAIRSREKLGALQEWLRELLGRPVFRSNALESFGQAQSDSVGLVTLEASTIKIRSIPAPPVTGDMPAHDLPAISVADHLIPLTYDLYLALQLRRFHCATGSLPASVRAALDRIRQLHAGDACRNQEDFLERGTKFVIRNRGHVLLEADHVAPTFRAT